MSKATQGSMSLYTATCLVVANMVGTGVFTSLGYQVATKVGFAGDGNLTPFVILMLWLVGGVCAFCGGVAYAELAAALPRSGGEYHFLARIFHPSVGFVAGWASITAGFAAPVALAAMAFGKYIHGVHPPLAEMPMTFAALAVVTAAMLASTRLREWFQNAATSLSFFAILAFLAAGFLAPAHGSALAPLHGDAMRIFSPGFATSLIYVMFAYAGWNASTYVTGEVSNPSRNVPLSMALGTGIVTVLYVALNAIFLRAAPAAELAGKNEVGLIAGTHLFGTTGGKWMALLIAGGLLANIGSMQWIGPRVFATMGEDSRVLRPFARLNSGGIPIFATLAQTGIVALMIATGTFQRVLTYVQFTITLCSALAVLGVFVLRWREPALPRPVRAWGYPVTPLIFLAVNGWMMWHVLRETPRESLAGLATLLAGLAVFYLSERRPMKTILLLLCLATTAGAQTPSPDDTARFLAGMPLENTSLQGFTLVPAWRDHAKQLDRAWDSNETGRLARIRAWAPDALGEAHKSALPVFYFFSGADFLYPQTLFPGAGTYVFCAREPVGSQPDPARIPPGELRPALATLRKSLTSLFDFSFFITKDLRKDVGQKHFQGVLPVLELMVVRTGGHIAEITTVQCSKSGEITADGNAKGAVPGVRIRFTDAGNHEHNLYYFYSDLSNDGLKGNDGVLLFCENLGRGQSLLKAASYLPHESEFTHIRDWLLAHSRTILQDGSGVPFRNFDAEKWKIRFWGNQPDPIPLFAKYAQADLRSAVRSAPRSPLPFGFGYQHLDGNSLLILAQRTGED